MLVKNILLLITGVLITITSFADGKHTISGKIKDKVSGEELFGVVLVVKELNKSVQSDENGNYEILVPSGDYTLLISYLGYRKYSQSISVQKNLILNYDIEEDVTEISEVIVNGQRQDNNITDLKMSANTLEIKDLKTLPALFGEVDVLKNIQTLPGVQSAGEGTTGFYVRGGSADQNLILMDGAPVYNAAHLLGFFSVFNADILKSADIYKGGIPAEYGGRLSSLVDVKTRNGNDKTYHATASIGLLSSKASVEGPIKKDKSSFIFSARRTYADVLLKLSSDPSTSKNKLYFYDLNTRLNFKLNEKNKLTIAAYHGKDVFAFAKQFGLSWGNTTGSIVLDHVFNKRFFASTSLLYSKFSYNLFFNSGTQGINWYSNLQEFTAKQDFTNILSEKNTVKYGIWGSYRTFRPGDITPTGEDQVFKSVHLNKNYATEAGAFISNDQKLSNRLSLQYGLRFTLFTQVGQTDIYSYSSGVPQPNTLTDTTKYNKLQPIITYPGLEPRFSARYIISPSISIKASYNHMIQYLHLISNATAPLPTNSWLPSSQHLKPQVSDQIATGIFKNFKENMFEGSVEVYYKWMDRVTDFKDNANVIANNTIETEVRQGKGTSYGAEFFLKKKSGRVTGWISYTLSKSTRQIQDVNEGREYRADYDRRHNFNFISNYKLTDRWTVGTAFVYSTGRPVTLPVATGKVDYLVFPYYTERNGYLMPAFHRLDVSGTYTRKHKKNPNIELSHNISIYNLYSRKNPFTVYAQDVTDANGNTNPQDKQIVMIWLFPLIPSYSFTITF